MWLSSTQPTTHQMLRPRAICSSSGICQVRSIVRRVFPLATATSTSNNVSLKVFCRFYSNFYCFIRRYRKIARTFSSTQLLNTVDRLRVIRYIHESYWFNDKESYIFQSHRHGRCLCSSEPKNGSNESDRKDGISDRIHFEDQSRGSDMRSLRREIIRKINHRYPWVNIEEKMVIL